MEAEWARSICGEIGRPFESVPKRSGSCFFHVCQLQIHVSSEEFTFAWIGTVTGSIGLEDRLDQGTELRFQLRAAGLAVQLHAPALAADEPRFAQDPEMMAQRRLGETAVMGLQEGGAGLRAVGRGELRVDARAHRVREGVEDAFDGDLVEARMMQRSHKRTINELDLKFNSSIVRN